MLLSQNPSIRPPIEILTGSPTSSTNPRLFSLTNLIHCHGKVTESLVPGGIRENIRHAGISNGKRLPWTMSHLA